LFSLLYKKKFFWGRYLVHYFANEGEETGVEEVDATINGVGDV